MQTVKVKKTTLKAGLASNGSTIQVKEFVDSQGNEVALADFGTQFVVVVSQSGNVEIIVCDGITQAAAANDTSATLDIKTNGRNLLPKSPYTGNSTGLSFTAGAEVIVTDDPYTMSFFLQADIDTDISAVFNFSQFPTKSGSTTPTDAEQFATKAYVDSIALGDAVTSALKSSITYGEDVTAGDPVYLKASDGKWWRAYANDPATCIGVELGIANEDAVADASGVITRRGRDTTQTGMTIGADYYLTDAGALSTTAGSYVVKFGTAVSATVLAVDVENGDRKHFLDAVTGMLVPFAGTSVPTGFLACDGSLFSFTAYPDLFAVIGTKYGIGDGIDFTVTAANDTIDLVAHGLSNGTLLRLTSTDTLPAGLSTETDYYVVEAATNTFKLSTTEGGAAVDITSAGTGTHSFHTQFKVPDLRGSVVVGSGQKDYGFTFTAATNSFGNVSDTDASSDWVQLPTSVGDNASVMFATSFLGVSADTHYYARNAGTIINLSTSYAAAVAGSSSIVNILGDGGSGYAAFGEATFTASKNMVDVLVTGTIVTLTTTGTLPTGLATSTNYYLIRVSNTTFKLAKSMIEANAGIGIPITDVGTGTHSVEYALTNRVVGEEGGDETHRLTVAELPSHNHGSMQYNTGSDNIDASDSGGNNANTDGVGGDIGGDSPHNNMQPFVVANWIIKT